MKYCLLGLAMMVAGIPLLEVHAYLGFGLFMIGGGLVVWFKDDARRSVMDRAVAKGLEIRAAREAKRHK